MCEIDLLKHVRTQRQKRRFKALNNCLAECVPPFSCRKLAACFCQLEARFVLADFTMEATQFNFALIKLGEEGIKEDSYKSLSTPQ